MLASNQQIEEVFFFAGLFEWENTLHDDENNYCKRKHVHFFTLVLFAFFDFWRHVGQCTPVALERVNLFVSRKSEVGDF